jgi:anti-sigma regulatory factor (Ser/Thr protein kinase)
MPNQNECVRVLSGGSSLQGVHAVDFPAAETDWPLVATPPTAFIEIAGQPRRLPSHHLDLIDPQPSFIAVFSTGSAHQMPMARLLVKQLAAMQNLKPHQSWGIQTTLHELIVNAINHGNLGCSALLHQYRNDLTALARNVSARLADPNFTNRLLTVSMALRPGHVTCTVADEGEGFNVAQILGRIRDEGQRYQGRGILMAQKLSSRLQFRADGRVAEAVFDL